MGGGGKKASTPAPSPYEASAAQIAQETYKQTDPLRQNILAGMESFLGGGYNPQADPRFAPMYSTAKYGAEKQYGVARDNILANTPRGGGRDSAIGALEGSRAEDVGQINNVITTNLINDLLSKTYGVAFNAPQQSMAGLTSVAGTYGNRASMSQAAAAQQTAGLYGGLGQLGGLALGGFLGGGKKK